MTMRASLMAILLMVSSSEFASADMGPGPRQRPGQGMNQNQPNDDAGVLAGGFLCAIAIGAIIGIGIKIWIILFIASDAKKRGMDPTMWIILEIFVGLVGLIVYLCVREPLLSERRRSRRYEADDDDYDRPRRRRVRDDDDY